MVTGQVSQYPVNSDINIKTSGNVPQDNDQGEVMSANYNNSVK